MAKKSLSLAAMTTTQSFSTEIFVATDARLATTARPMTTTGKPEVTQCGHIRSRSDVKYAAKIAQLIAATLKTGYENK